MSSELLNSRNVTSIPIPNLDWGLTDKERRRQLNKKRQSARKIARRKQYCTDLYVRKWRRILQVRKHEDFESHAGFKSLVSSGYERLASKWRDLCLSAEDAHMDTILNIGENIILFLLAAKDCTTISQFVAILTLFVKTYTSDKSIIQTVVEQLTPTYTSVFKDYDDAWDSSLDDDSIFNGDSQAGFFSTILSSFATLKKSPLFTHFSTLIATLLSLGFLSESKKLSYSIKGMEIFQIAAAKGHRNCTDLIEVILVTMQFLVERGWRCFTTKSINPLLFEDDAAYEFQIEYNDFISKYEFVKLGEFEKSPWLDEQDFDLKLTDIVDRCKLFLKAASQHDRNIIGRYLERLEKIRTDFELTRAKSGMRFSPYTFLIHGPSSIAKSTIVNNLMVFALQQIAWAEGKTQYVVNPKSICTLNELDKYHSDYKSHIQAVLLDDLANAKQGTTGVNPAVNVINFINNIFRTAIMAEADLKGKIQIKPKVVAVTTNNWVTWAEECSVEPVSLLRRFEIHIKASVKKDYRADQTAISGSKLAEDAAEGIYNPDAWDFRVLRCYGQTQDNDESAQQARFKCVFTGKDVADIPPRLVSMGELLAFMKDHIAHHCKIQSSVVSSSEGIFAQTLCEHGNHAHYCQPCKEKPKQEPEVPCNLCEGVPLPSDQVLVQGVPLPSKQVLVQGVPMPSDQTLVEGVPVNLNYREHKDIHNFDSQFGWNPSWYVNRGRERFEDLYARHITNTGIFRWECYIPRWQFENYKFQYTYSYWKNHSYTSQYMKFTALSAFCCLILAPLHVFSCIGSMLLAGAIAFEKQKRETIDELVASRETLPTIFKNIRDMDKELGKKLFFFAAAVLALVALYRTFKRFEKITESHGNQISVHMEEENVWKEPVIAPLPTSDAGTCSTSQLSNIIKKQQVFLVIGDRFCNGLIVGGNAMLIPGHMVPKKYISCEVTFAGKQKLSDLDFKTGINPEDCFKLPETDLALVYMPRLGDRKNLTKYFPNEITDHPILTTSLWRNEEGSIETDSTRFRNFKQVETAEAKFYGPIVRYSRPTFKGQCLATHLNISDCSFIAGFHAAGKTGQSEGALTRCTKQQLQSAFDKLSERNTVVWCAHSGPMKTESYGIDYKPNEFLADSSPLRYQTEAQVSIFGTMPFGGVRPKSSVIESPISKVVEKVTGTPRIHGKPANCRRHGEPGRVPAWAPYQKYLTGAGNAYQEFPADVLDWAFTDYVKGLEGIVSTPYGKDLLSKVRILDDVETVSGVDGMRFVDQMKSSTSMGWPLNKNKASFLVPAEHPTLTCPRLLDEETMRLAEEHRQLWLNDTRSYEVFKTCTKDEPTKITKEKVRCFQAAPVSLQVNIRKYFLTICHFLSKSNLVSECAVGVNAEGPGWHELNEYMLKYGRDNVVAGDFSAFDQSMSARMILQAGKVFEHIAKLAGYSDRDLKIMRGATTEVAYPLMSLNGELIQLYGSNPSGQNLTVYTNSVVNSLYHRCVFRTLYPNYSGSFRDAVALMTYGDDAKMSVNKSLFPKYNHTMIQSVFAKYGISYTMAEKDASSVPFITHEEADFLKRKSRFDKRVGYTERDGTIHNGIWVSMLEEDSIFKSLHSNLKSKSESAEAVAIDCIEGAMRSWFFYGREHFEYRHEQMKEVVRIMEWENFMSDSFEDSYEIRYSKWVEKYNLTEL